MITRVRTQFLKDTSGTEIKNYSLTNGTAVNTAGIDMRNNAGFDSMVFLSHGGSDDVDLSWEVSYDNQNWYSPVDVDNTSLVTTITALSADRWIELNTALAPWLRFVLDPDADSTVSLVHITRENV